MLWLLRKTEIGIVRDIDMNSTLKIAFYASSFFLCSCSSSDNLSEKEKYYNCNQYLIDTGYHRVDDLKEKHKAMTKIGVPKEEEGDFCIGRLTEENGHYCYLAMPNDGRMDGHYTDCPYHLLR